PTDMRFEDYREMVNFCLGMGGIGCESRFLLLMWRYLTTVVRQNYFWQMAKVETKSGKSQNWQNSGETMAKWRNSGKTLVKLKRLEKVKYSEDQIL
ncbi:13913_t:CDS:1, partial [Ambispora leptoticha]